MCHHARMTFAFLVETGFCHIAQASLELLGSTSIKYQDHRHEPWHLACFMVLGFFCCFETEFHSCHPGWSAVAQSRLTATSASWVLVILLPQPPK